jgi:FPC/CPF motif-containing protein YcgG
LTSFRPTYRPDIIEHFYDFIKLKDYPCVAAKAAAAQNHIACMVAPDMTSEAGNADILGFIYEFVDEYRSSQGRYHSAAIIFEHPAIRNEEEFETLLWKKLQSLSDLDAQHHNYDERVSDDPQSPLFSFSLKEEAFFIVAMHPQSSRLARKFTYPVLVFNPHQQFEELRKNNHFDQMKTTVRLRDHHFSGSVNPMLEDFGTFSETRQYSGRIYDEHWKCPLQIKHGKSADNSAA